MFGPVNRWHIAKTFFSVSLPEFIRANDVFQRQLEEVTKQKYGLTVTFYKAARRSGDPHHDAKIKPVKLFDVDSMNKVKGKDWAISDMIEATYTARDMQQPYKASVCAKWPDTRKISFEFQPSGEMSEKLWRRFLNEDRTFLFWGRGIGVG